MGEVLVVDDDPDILDLVKHVAEAAGHRVDGADSCRAALQRIERRSYDVMVLDVRLPDGTGPELLPRIRAIRPDLAVVVLTAYGSTDIALAAIQAGASDFIQKEELRTRLLPAISGLLQRTAQHAFAPIVTRSKAMRDVLAQLEPALASRVPVLVRGESGTGKELVARALHDGGPRREEPFVAINCAGIPEQLLEAELFGYERGAFTGAVSRKPGRFELAREGTLLLDEVAELHPALQAKLLRVLQGGEFVRLGGVEVLRSEARVIAATHRDLEREVEEGQFRQDLYYRLAVFTIELPPLRERAGDVELLARHFLAETAAREGKAVDGFEPMVLDLLRGYSFPGNVRELQNVVIHAVVATRTRTVRIADLPAGFLRAVAGERKPASTPPAETTPPGGEFPTLRELERRHVLAALDRAAGNKAEAARLLGVSRMTLYRKIEEYHLG